VSIGHSEVGNPLSQPHIQGMNQNIRDRGQHGNSSIVEGDVNLIAAQKCICWTHLRTRTVVPHEVIVLHEHRPPSLLSGEILRRLEVCQVLMICDNGDRVFCASQVLMPLFKCPYDHEKFVIIDVIISLGRSESLQVIGTGVEIPVAILLHQHSTRGNKQSVSYDEAREVGIRVMEDRALEKRVFELLERTLVVGYLHGYSISISTGGFGSCTHGYVVYWLIHYIYTSVHPLCHWHRK